MSDVGQSSHSVGFHRERRAYDRFEFSLCCILWPAVSVASATLLYWFWVDNPNPPGLSAKLASMVFVVVFIAATFCTIDLLTRLVARMLRRPTGRSLPHHSPSSCDAHVV